MANKASLSPTRGRPGFSVSFRHPLRIDSKGKPGLKVRRGLGTSDEAKANQLVDQLNELLADESWWNAGRYAEALAKFEPRVVEAFYDGIQAGTTDSKELRNKIIAMPGKAEGYSRVLFVGTTGAGKTSLLRHLIGSDTNHDRFPSTSTAKTTVADIEVIPADGGFSAAVTFCSDLVIQANVEDCILSACGAVWDNMPEDKVVDKFLHHADQRFRLSYVLGNPQKKGHEDLQDEDDWSFEEQEPASSDSYDGDEIVSPSDKQRQQQVLDSFLERIKSLANETAEEIKSELIPNPMAAAPEDREAAAEIFQSELFVSESFHELVQDVMDEILLRFDRLEMGTLSYRGAGSSWPEMWTYESDNRDDFLRHVRWFSSNYAPSFGRLLTPLVDGIRVRGPLFPKFTERHAKIVYLDGQGLGHTPDSSSSVTTHITKRFGEVDAILLVDNAEQPIQAAAQSVLRAAAASGNYGKLVIAFTHFDQVKGLNLPNFDSKRSHILASIHNYLIRLKEVLNGPIVAAMERTIDDQCVMLGGLQEASDRLPTGVRRQLTSLLDVFEKAIQPPPIRDAKPTYDPSGLGFAVQRAAQNFQQAWAARLGMTFSPSINAEHWTRVKAMNRRIANEWDIEYDSLRPVADFVGRISEEISNFLDNPIAWSRAPTDESEAQDSIAPIRQSVFEALHDLAMHRVVSDHLVEWRRSLAQSGKGSATRRATEIRGIYALAVPVPGTVNTEPSLDFMKSVRAIVKSAIEAQGGSMRSP